MNVLILAPHQDDEILCAAGLIQRVRDRGDDVFVLFATNGDYHGLDIARKRYYESRDALELLTVDASKIFYLGYRDTGMRPCHSFLWQLLLSPMSDALVSFQTYHPAGMETVRFLRTGAEGPLSKMLFLEDLTWFLAQCNPGLLVVPSRVDAHGDHSALADLTELAYKGNLPPRLSYLIHGGDDIHWPPRTLEDISRPPVVTRNLWAQRFIMQLSDSQRQLKQKAIDMFSTQLSEDHTGFLHAFAGREELFFLQPKDAKRLRESIGLFDSICYPTR